jgi:hypothetical protein
MYDRIKQQLDPKVRLVLVLFFKNHDKLNDEQAEQRVHEMERWLANGWHHELVDWH